MAILVFDVETTGVNSKVDRIIEFGAVAFDLEGKILARFGRLVDPGFLISEETTRITGITQKMIDKDGQPWSAISDKIYEWVTKAPVWVGQNVWFDIRFLTEEFARVGVELKHNRPIIDTLVIARRYIPNDILKSKKLGKIANFYNVQMSIAHRAVEDSEATGQVLFEMTRDLDLTIDELASYNAVCLGKHHIGSDPFEALFEGRPVKGW